MLRSWRVERVSARGSPPPHPNSTLARVRIMSDRRGSIQGAATVAEQIPLLPEKDACRRRDQDSSIATAKATDHRRWPAIFFGQIIALALSCSNAASATLENDYQIKVPTFQTGLVYFILSFHLMYLFWKHRIKENHGEQKEDREGSHRFPFTTLPLCTPWQCYFLLSILDVEANYLAMLSFQHTSLSSSMLLTSLSVLSTVLWRRIIFRRNDCGRSKLFGIAVVLVGGCLWLREECDGARADTGADQDDGAFHSAPGHKQPFQGDLLALLAAGLYGLNDVVAEYFVKASNDRAEYLGMLGFFGALFSFAVQVPLLEKERLQKIWASASRMHGEHAFELDDGGDGFTSITRPLFLLLCFLFLLCYFYISVMAFLSMYDATVLNLSLQSCPLWAVVVAICQNFASDSADGVRLPPPTFFASVALVVAGMLLYEHRSRNESGRAEREQTE